MLTCRHIKANGRRCGSPAMTGKPYCFFHMKFDQMYKRDVPEIPPIEDSTSVLLAVGQVVRALNYETMNTKRAGLMFYGLQIASNIAARLEKAEPVETVRSVHNLAGDPLDFTEAAKFGMDMLAPNDPICESQNNCPNSNHSCEKASASVEPEASAERKSSLDPEAPLTPDSVAIMEAGIDDPTLSPVERKKHIFAYVKYLKEEAAKHPPLENLSINAQSDSDEEHVPVSPMAGAPGPCVRTWESEHSIPTNKAGAPSLRRLLSQGWETTNSPSHKNDPVSRPVAPTCRAEAPLA